MEETKFFELKKYDPLSRRFELKLTGRFYFCSRYVQFHV